VLGSVCYLLRPEPNIHIADQLYFDNLTTSSKGSSTHLNRSQRFPDKPAVGLCCLYLQHISPTTSMSLRPRCCCCCPPSTAGGGPYSPTVTTPVTDFNLRANSVVREPEIQQYWAQHQVYEHLASSNAGVSGRCQAVCSSLQLLRLVLC
jgi:hypothetical protein